MTQAIGQEPLLTTLYPLPAGSSIMGGQEKGQCHQGRRTRGSPRDWTVSDQRLGLLMPSRIPGNILLPSTKTWNTYSPGHCGSYLPQVHPTGLGTTLCHTRSAVCVLPCKRTTIAGRQTRGCDSRKKQKEGRKK
jgi:hypothetical protein